MHLVTHAAVFTTPHVGLFTILLASLNLLGGWKTINDGHSNLNLLVDQFLDGISDIKSK